MKYLVLLLIGLTCNSLSAQQIKSGGKPFMFTGNIVGQEDGIVFLRYTNSEGKQVKDSCMVENGNFTFKGNIAEPTMAYFSGAVKSNSMSDPNYTTLWLEPSDMKMTAKVNDLKNARITGSETEEEANELQRLLQPVDDEAKPLDEAYEKINKEYIAAVRQKKDQKIIDSLKEKAAAMHDEFGPYQERAAKINYAFFTAHPSSYVTAFNLRFYVSSLPLDSLQMFYDRMNAALQQSSYGKLIAGEIKKLRAGSPGSMAKDFTTKDIHDQPVSLSDFRGKYVILDFWASWCVPCRHSNPHMIALYKEYHDKGLEIIGVSDDDNKPEAWKKAVAQDGVGIWHNVLRGLDMESVRKHGYEDQPGDISEKFGIHTLPTKILIDPKGMIIGRYGGGGESDEAMDEKLKEVFNHG